MISQRLYGLCFAAVLMLVPFGTAQAVTIHLEFEAKDFVCASCATVAPQDPVTGSIFYEAASTTAAIEDITGVDLTIDGYSYQLEEVSFDTKGTSLVLQCATTAPGSNCAIGGSARDFSIRWQQDNPDNASQRFFAYSVENSGGDYWTTTTFENFTLSEVPVPPAVLLFGSGLLGLIGAARRRRLT